MKPMSSFRWAIDNTVVGRCRWLRLIAAKRWAIVLFKWDGK